MGLLEAVVVSVVGYVSGTVTRSFAGVAAAVALVLAVFGLAAPAAVFDAVDQVVSFSAGNELLFVPGFPSATGHRERDRS